MGLLKKSLRILAEMAIDDFIGFEGIHYARTASLSARAI